MNKIAIPALLVATVMVAGAFAFMPVEQASTVHTSGTLTLSSSADVTDILLDTGTTLPGEHGALPSTTEVTDLSTETVLTAPGTLVASGTAGIAFVTCSGFTANGGTDTLEVGGTTYADVQDAEFIMDITAGQAVTWVINAGADAATCTAILMS